MPADVITTRERTLFGALLFGAMAVAIFSAPAVGILSRFIIDDFGITRTQLGWVVTAITLTAAVTSPLAGRISDVAGGRAALLLLCIVSAAGLAALAGAPTYALLLGAAAVAGFAQAMGNPATNTAIVLHVPLGERGTITGVKQSGVQAGSFLGGVLLPAGALAMGWRPTMVVAAAIPVVLLFAMLRLVPRDPERVVAAVAGRRGPVPAAAWWLAGYGLAMGFGQGALLTYLPLYIQEDVGLSVTTAGIVVAVSGLVAVPMRILWGRSSERDRYFSTSLSLLAAGSVGATALVWLAAPGTTWPLWLGAVLLGATAGSWNAVGMVAVMAAAGPGGAGRASGVVLAGFSLGLAVGPPVFGFSVDSTGGYATALAIAVVVFALALLVAALWWWLDRRPAPAGNVRAGDPVGPVEAGTPGGP